MERLIANLEEHALLRARHDEVSEAYTTLRAGFDEEIEGTRDAARRELLEETGLEADLDPDPVEWVEVDSPARDAVPAFRFRIAVYLATRPQGTLTAGDDAQDAAWVRIADLDGRPMTPGTAARIRRLTGG
mgnify:CR=1 FL=1